MRTLLLSLILFSSVALAQPEQHVVVVINSANDIEQLDKRTLRNLYMGGVNRYGLTPVALVTGSTGRVIFNTKVLGLTESRIQSYWAQMRFSGGRARPPREVSSAEDAIALIEANPNMITYLPAETVLPATVKVIYNSEQSGGSNP